MTATSTVYNSSTASTYITVLSPLAIRHVEPTHFLEATEPPAKHPEVRDYESKDLHFE